MQMMIYLLGMTKKHEVETYELAVIQPRVDEEPSRWMCSAEDLDIFKSELIRHVALTKEPNAMLMPGSHCKWCLAKPNCPALRKEVGQVMTPIVPSTKPLFPNVKTLTTAQIVKIMDNKGMIEEWLSAVAGYAFEMLESGQQVPGYTLAKKRAHRKWADKAAVISAFADLGDELFKTELKTPAQLEKLVGKERKKEVSNLTTIPDIGYTIKKEG